MRKICIIPARGGSKRIPRKNIRDFLGKPIISYSIEAAINSGLFDTVMVSTDDLEISKISKKYGASVPFLRSEVASDDYATTADVILEVLNQFKSEGTKFDFACCCYATAPFVTSQRLIEGFDKLVSQKADSVFPIAAFSYPIFRSLRKTEQDRVIMNWPENLNKRSQDLPNYFHDAGQWYWFAVDRFLTKRQIFSEISIGLELSPYEVQDIDNEFDWKLAELKYEFLQGLK